MKSGTSSNKESQIIEKIMVVLAAGITIISFLLGYRVYALGVILAAVVGLFLYRWQMMAVTNTEGLSPQKATNRLLARSMIKLLVFIIMIGLSYLGGIIFLFGVLTGLLLQVMAHIGQAFVIYGGTRK